MLLFRYEPEQTEGNYFNAEHTLKNFLRDVNTHLQDCSVSLSGGSMQKKNISTQRFPNSVPVFRRWNQIITAFSEVSEKKRKTLKRVFSILHLSRNIICIKVVLPSGYITNNIFSSTNCLQISKYDTKIKFFLTFHKDRQDVHVHANGLNVGVNALI